MAFLGIYLKIFLFFCTIDQKKRKNNSSKLFVEFLEIQTENFKYS
jgi:hypothetical protein